MQRHEILIIGAGLAGQRAAVEALKTCKDVAILSKVYPLRSHSVAAQGGINAAIDRNDSYYDHMYDTVYGSDFLADQDAVEILCKSAPDAVREFEGWGVVFSRNKDGTMAQRAFGGQHFNRTCYAADRTGHQLLHTMYDQIMKSGVTIFPEHYALNLVVEKGICKGVIVLDITTGKIESIEAKAVLIATGGYGRAFSITSASFSSTGDGVALAYRAGIPLMDMEMVQFHPTGIYGRGTLISEASRGEGSYLLNKHGERFMQRYAPQKLELASRDVVTRAIQTEINEGRGCGPKGDHVSLDLRHLGKKKIDEKLPQVKKLIFDYLGIDCSKELVPVAPTAHYSMGGIPCNTKTEVLSSPSGTTIKGLYVAGESSCVSVHGANRLGGNSLLETIVFGKVAGAEMATFVRKKEFHPIDKKEVAAATRELEKLRKAKGNENASQIREELGAMMMSHCGIFRGAETLNEGLKILKQLRKRFKKIGPMDRNLIFNTELVETLETRNLLEFSEAILASALARRESRGSHMRLDYKERDDMHFLAHLMAYKTDTGVLLRKKPVVVTKFGLEKRHY